MGSCGEVFFLEHPGWGCRPVLILSRDAAIRVLKWVTVASVSKRVRGK